MRKKTWIKWAVAIFVTVALVGASVAWYLSPGMGNGEIVARINGHTITRDEFQQHLEDVYGMEALETLILYQVILEAADKAGVTPSDEDIDAEIASMKDQFGDFGFEQFLAQYGMSEEAFRYNLLIGTALDEIRFAEVEITDDEVREFFEENREDFDIPQQVRASHILVGNEEQAEEILDDVIGGADFAELAERYSLDTASGNQGGDLGFFPPGTMYPEFEAACFDMEVGEVRGPVVTQAGYHIIKLTDREEAQEAVFEEVRDEVEYAYKAALAPSREELIHRLQNEAEIQIITPQFQRGF